MLATKIKNSLFLSLAFGLLACSSGGKQGEDNYSAYLSIVGDKNVFMENGWTEKLTVRYHDGSNAPLRGDIQFRIIGAADGAKLSANGDVTDSQGYAEVDLTAGENNDATFTVQASAPDARAVTWTIAVSDVLPGLDPTGRYEVTSEFDVVSGLDGGFGEGLNIFIDVTDDPAHWLIDQALKKAPDSVKTILSLFRKPIEDALDQAILTHAPDLVLDLMDLGSMMEDVARHFGTVSTLEIKPLANSDTDNYGHSATHAIDAFTFNIAGDLYNFGVDEMDISEIRAENISISQGDDRMLSIAQHDMPISWGSMYVIALQQAIIPALDPDASDLGDYLNNRVDCGQVGQSIYDQIGDSVPLADENFYESLCETALEAVAAVAIDKILDYDDAGVILRISGKARPRDTNNDKKVDTLQTGKWTGVIDYSGTQATLDADKNIFSATRR